VKANRKFLLPNTPTLRRVHVLLRKKKLKGGLWEIEYLPIDLFRKLKECSCGFGTCVSKETCPEIEDLKPGDKIVIIYSDWPRVLEVRKC